MSNDDLDRILASEGAITPSSGFAANVMDAVRRGAAAPEPIGFPWKRALWGLTGCLIALVYGVVVLFGQVVRGGMTSTTASWPVVNAIIEGARTAGVGWIVLALVVSYAAATLPRNFMRART